MNKHTIKSDSLLNSALQDEVQGLRGIFHQAAESQPLSDRFTTQNDPDSPSVFITDTTTNKTTKIPIFAYRDTRRALTELFGE